jgi:hypothetical protein
VLALAPIRRRGAVPAGAAARRSGRHRHRRRRGAGATAGGSGPRPYRSASTSSRSRKPPTGAPCRAGSPVQARAGPDAAVGPGRGGSRRAAGVGDDLAARPGGPGGRGGWPAGRAARSTRDAAPRSGPKQRAGRVAGGLEELDRWLLDQVTHGLAEAERDGEAPVRGDGRRLVDAQAGTAAEAVRRAGRAVGVGPRWADRCSAGWRCCGCWCVGHRRIDELPPGLAATVRSRIGFPVPREQVLTGPRVRDRWQVVGRSSRGRRAAAHPAAPGLRGAGTGRPALLLSFTPLGGTLPERAAGGRRARRRPVLPPGRGAGAGARWPSGTATPSRSTEPTGGDTVRGRAGRGRGLRAADPWLGDVRSCSTRSARPAPASWSTGPATRWPAAAGRRGAVVAPGGLRRPPDHRGRRAGAGRAWRAHRVGGRRPVSAPAGDLERGRPIGIGHPALPPELVSAALVGVAAAVGWRRGAGGAGRRLALPAADRGGGLLDAAGRRAGLPRGRSRAGRRRRPRRGGRRETRRALPAAAAARPRLLAGRGVPGGRGVAAVLLTSWLAARRGRGVRAPAAALPALLDLGRRHVGAAPGRRAGGRAPAAWLAQRRARVALPARRGSRRARPAPTWETGTPGERRAPPGGAAPARPGGRARPCSARASTPSRPTSAPGSWPRSGDGPGPGRRAAARARARRPAPGGARGRGRAAAAGCPGRRSGRRMAARATAAVREERRCRGRTAG